MKLHWLALPLIACTQPEETKPDEARDSIDFAQHQSALKYVRLEPVKKETIRPSLDLPGKIAFDEDHTQRVAVPIDGRVHALRVKLGDKVKVGTPLIEVSSPQVAQMQSDLRKAEEDATIAKKNFERAKQLQADDAVSAKDYAQAEADQRKSEVEVTRVRSQLAVLGISDHATVVATLTAQIAGAVVERNVLPGQEVRADGANPLLTVSDLTHVWALAEIFEADLSLVDPGDKVEIRVPAWPDDVFKGEVAYVGDVVDPTARTVKVRCLIANPDLKLKPEMFAKVKVDAGEDLSTILVPSAAVLANGDKTEVVASGPDHKFRVRAVKVGNEIDGRVRVYEGLQEGDIIVTRGALYARQEIRDQ
jgi:cobalt-zinc-cadmium efflux system membrane fusion protein